MTVPASTQAPARTTTWVKRFGIASVVANCTLVVTGGAVRLSGSGLGCPTWPRCTDKSFTPHNALSMHSAIEFSNRMLTFVLVFVAVATFVVAWRTGRKDLRRLSTYLALGIPAQAVIGGITVLTDLNPWLVSFHLLCSMAMISLAVRFVQVADAPATERARGPIVGLAWGTYAATWAVLYVGTVVTGSGPHAGDKSSARNGLSPLQLSQLHADLVFLLVGLTLGLLIGVLAAKAPTATRHAVIALLGVELAQGAIGFVQYFTGLPEVVVGCHLLGAALVMVASTWALLAVRSDGASPAPAAPDQVGHRDHAAELSTTIAHAQRRRDPLTSAAGRRARSTSATTFSAPSTPAPTRSSRRALGLRSRQRRVVMIRR